MSGCSASIQQETLSPDYEAINREQFRPILEQPRKKTRKSAAGAKGCDLIVLVKAPILQSLYTLSDHALEFQIPDRSSFSRFLGLHAASEVPDLLSGFSVSI